MAPKKFLVEKILKKRVQDGQTEYYIKWQGYPMSSSTWEPAKNCDCPDLVHAFEKSSKPITRKRTSNDSVLQRRKPSGTPGKTRAVKSPAKPQSGRKQNEESDESETSDSTSTEEPPSPPRIAGRRVAENNSSKVTVKKSRMVEDDVPNDEPCSSTQTRSLVNKPQSSKNDFTPASDIRDLKFKVASIKGMLQPHGDEVVVLDGKGKEHVVKCKAVVKQNVDLMMNYFMALPRSR